MGDCVGVSLLIVCVASSHCAATAACRPVAAAVLSPLILVLVSSALTHLPHLSVVAKIHLQQISHQSNLVKRGIAEASPPKSSFVFAS